MACHLKLDNNHRPAFAKASAGIFREVLITFKEAKDGALR